MNFSGYRRFASLALAALALFSTLAPAQAADDGWANYNKGYDGQRYSSLRQITRENVARLGPVCEAEVGDMGPLQSGLLVVGKRLYLTTPRSTLALDATTCAVLWRNVHVGNAYNFNPSNRGPAYADGRVFRGTAEGEILAIDAATGKELWRVKGGEPAKGEIFSSAPMVWRGRVYIGTSGGDWGGQARVMAYDVRDGRELWRFHVIPQDGEPGADTWKLPAGAQRGGGAVWAAYSLDQKSGELYVSTGNPAPALAPGLREGANLYTDSVLALDAATGKLRWYLQLIPGDALDYDLSAPPMLYRDAGGRARVAVGGKDGFLHLIDRTRRERFAKVPVTTIVNPDAIPTVEGVRVCPGVYGGVAWNGPAYDPQSHTVYVGAIDMCMIYYYHGGNLSHPAVSFGTIAQPSMAPEDAFSGWVTAVDGTTGKTRWKYHAAAPIIAGVTVTAGGLVLTGDSHGTFLALDARDGKELRKFETGGTMAGGVVTYSVEGRQYVAFAAGGVVRGNIMKAVIAPRVVIAALDPPAGGPASVKLPELEVIPPPATGAAAAQARGGALYAKLCTICHGAAGEGLTAPRLKGVDKRADARPLRDIIKDPSPAMARFYPGVLSDQDLDDLVTFLENWK